jgi:AcrR family transcriptional regulator
VSTDQKRPAEGLRERHRRQTAATLEEVALRLFTERGFDAVTVDDIAAGADVCRRTFFRYYASKEDVVLSDHPDRLDEIRENLIARPADEPPLTALRHTLLALVDRYSDDRPRMLQRFRIMAATPSLQGRSLVHQRAWETAVTEIVAERMNVDPKTDLRPAVVAATTLAALRVAVGAWFNSDGEADVAALFEETLDLLDGGLHRADSGRPLVAVAGRGR